MNLLNDFEAMAKALLPCECWSPIEHLTSCPAYYRPAVAAALAKIAQDTYEKVKDETRRYFGIKK